MEHTLVHKIHREKHFPSYSHTNSGNKTKQISTQALSRSKIKDKTNQKQRNLQELHLKNELMDYGAPVFIVWHTDAATSIGQWCIKREFFERIFPQQFLRSNRVQMQKLSPSLRGFHDKKRTKNPPSLVTCIHFALL